MCGTGTRLAATHSEWDTRRVLPRAHNSLSRTHCPSHHSRQRALCVAPTPSAPVGWPAFARPVPAGARYSPSLSRNPHRLQNQSVTPTMGTQTTGWPQVRAVCKQTHTSSAAATGSSGKKPRMFAGQPPPQPKPRPKLAPPSKVSPSQARQELFQRQAALAAELTRLGMPPMAEWTQGVQCGQTKEVSADQSATHTPPWRRGNPIIQHQRKVSSRLAHMQQITDRYVRMLCMRVAHCFIGASLRIDFLLHPHSRGLCACVCVCVCVYLSCTGPYQRVWGVSALS